MNYAADFETTVDKADCRVWAWALNEIEEPDGLNSFRYGNDIDQLAEILKKKSCKLFYHNLKFDGEFWLYWLFRNGFQWVESKDDLYTRSFCTLISDMGQWYSITICWERKMKNSIYTTIQDSLKLLPFKVESVAKAFNLSVSKLKIDYKEKRPKGHILTDHEIDYIRNDVYIMAKALNSLFAERMTAMTTGSNALKNYKEILGKDDFDYNFPTLTFECDQDIRKAYRGGFTYLMKKYRNKSVKAGRVYDTNSLYPYIMYSRLIPYDVPIFFEGQYSNDPLYPLYVQMITCQFRLKKGFIPTIQIKGSFLFNPVEYLESSEDEEITLCLTNVDLDLFLQHYDVYNITYHSGWKFKAKCGMFKEYIDKWMEAKITAKLEGNGALATLAKLMLNSLYGKLALNPVVQSKMPLYDPTEDLIHMKLQQEEQRNGIYIPAGLFITSYARQNTIAAAQLNYDRFIYADTDSLHLRGNGDPIGIKVDAFELGAWKNELVFSKAHYIRAKTYVEYGHDPAKDEKDVLKVTCAGLPEYCHDQVTFKNFRPGTVYHNKLRPVHVPGGIVLEDSNFNIKDDLFTNI